MITPPLQPKSSLRCAVRVAFVALVWVVGLAGQVQTAPITEPRGQQEQSAPIAKGAKAIIEQHEKCATRLRVDADALFRPHRWTLNPDAWETLDVLGPRIAKAGKHPARIVAYTAVADSESENRDVSERRALTVRTWLVDNSFLPAGTPIEGVGAVREAAPAESPSANDSRRSPSPATAERNNGSVDVVIDFCR